MLLRVALFSTIGWKFVDVKPRNSLVCEMYGNFGLREDGTDVFAVSTNSFLVLEAGFKCCAGSSRHSTAGQQKRAVHQLAPCLREVRRKLKIARSAAEKKPLLGNTGSSFVSTVRSSL